MNIWGRRRAGRGHVDKSNPLWTTAAISRQSPRVNAIDRQLTLNESVFRATVNVEGHPRGNGDGPLTTNRSLETIGG